eukprot:3462895-Pleurochrysis_carterae.AAC.3
MIGLLSAYAACPLAAVVLSFTRFSSIIECVDVDGIVGQSGSKLAGGMSVSHVSSSATSRDQFFGSLCARNAHFDRVKY